ncbi:MAG TPA: DUF1778 domain-containing protein [Devosia sp.]|nr:DUF1778 domain-containing protein [Devosia sp.]
MVNAASRSTHKRVQTRRQRDAIEEHGQPALSARDSEVFVDALLRAKPINARLRETVRRYRAKSQVLT